MKNYELSPSKEQTPSTNREIGEAAIEASQNISSEMEKEENLKMWATHYRTTERDFIKNPPSRFDIKTYEKWEDDAKYFFDRIIECEESIGCAGDSYKKDNLERLAGRVDGRDSIEAFAGNFYDERSKALINAINNSDSKEEEKEKDKATVRNLEQLALRFKEITHRRPDHVLTFDESKKAEEERKTAHNSVIWCLNDINELAEKYGTKPLTFRNFEDNDDRYDEDNDKYENLSGKISFKETEARKIYDRRAVEAYIWKAFDEDFRDVDERQPRSIIAQYHNAEDY